MWEFAGSRLPTAGQHAVARDAGFEDSTRCRTLRGMPAKFSFSFASE